MPHTILIVEDEPAQSNILRKRFENEGYQVAVATNGEEGLRMALHNHPDIILADIIMPVMDGLTMLSKLRQDSWGATAKVVILTNLSDNESVDKAMAEHTYDFLVKTDWKIGDVVTKVNERLGNGL